MEFYRGSVGGVQESQDHIPSGSCQPAVFGCLTYGLGSHNQKAGYLNWVAVKIYLM